jgi:hypothetical protein
MDCQQKSNYSKLKLISFNASSHFLFFRIFFYFSVNGRNSQTLTVWEGMKKFPSVTEGKVKKVNVLTERIQERKSLKNGEIGSNPLCTQAGL